MGRVVIRLSTEELLASLLDDTGIELDCTLLLEATLDDDGGAIELMAPLEETAMLLLEAELAGGFSATQPCSANSKPAAATLRPIVW